jgi:hypothetical protein
MKTLNRRHFLRGLGGVAVGLPFLASLQSARAASGFPLRFVVFTHGQGTLVDEMVKPGSTEHDWELGEILKPLSRHKDSLLVIDGIDDLTNLKDMPYNGHTRCRLHTLTAQGMVWGGSGDSVGPRSAGGPSIDQMVASRWGGQTAFQSIEAGVSVGAGVGNTITWRGVGAPVPAENKPSSLFNRLFSDLVSSSPQEVADRKRRRMSVLDAVKSQFDHLMPRLGIEDRARLDLHMTSIRSLEQNLMGSALGDSCGLPDTVLSDTSIPGITAAHIELLTMALSCDLTRVATLAFGGFNSFPWLPVNFSSGWHDAVHAGPVTSKLRTDLIRSYAWFAEQLATLMDALAAVPEGEGTLLDNTIILYANIFSSGGGHDHRGKTYLLAGGGGGALQTGRYLHHDGAPHGALHTSLLNVLGFDDTSFGNPDYCDGPLSGVI